MNLAQNIIQMRENAELISQISKNVGEDQARWKPEDEMWSILEVINHLYDEEREDFRTRLLYTLQRSGQSWPSIDPQGWVTQRRYNQRSLSSSLEKFLQERHISLDWLTSLESPDWRSQYEAPWGPITAGDLMAAWVAHDLLHIRQLVGLSWAWTVRRLSPFSPRYAGEW